MDFDNEVLNEYIDRLNRGKEEDRVDIYREIGTIGFPWDDNLLSLALSDSSPRVRSVVSEILIENSDPRIVETLLELLRNQDPGIRSVSMSILAGLGPVALPQVEYYLNDSDPDVRIFAAGILGESRLKQAFPALQKALTAPEENLRYAAAEALGKIGEKKAIPILVECLKDQWVRYPSIESLGLLDASEAIPELLGLYEEDEWVRVAVIEAVGKIGSSEQVDFLLGQMDEEDEIIMQACFTALARIEQRSPCGAFERLRKTGIDVDGIVTAGLNLHDPEIRKLAIWTLGLIGEEDHIHLLVAQLSDFDEDVRHTAREALLCLGARRLDALITQVDSHAEIALKKEIIEIIARIGDPLGVSAVMKALQGSDESLRETAARSLGLFKSHLAIDALIDHLNDPSGPVRAACALSLGMLRAVKATRGLLSVLEDEYSEARESASEALGRIGTTEAIRHVATLLKHDRMEVRQAAVQCLGLVMDKRVETYLVEALTNPDRGVRRFAANILGKRKTVQALRPLIICLLDEDWQVRKCAASALGNINDARSADALISAMNDENIWVRYASAIAVGRIGVEKARIALTKSLRRDTGPVRIAAVEGLFMVKDPGLVSLLAPLAKDPDEDLRRVVAETLGRIATEECTLILEEMVCDAHPKVSHAAIRALGRTPEIG